VIALDHVNVDGSGVPELDANVADRFLIIESTDKVGLDIVGLNRHDDVARLRVPEVRISHLIDPFCPSPGVRRGERRRVSIELYYVLTDK
jgi:hypothetical protein